jgi:hypothetical protein
MCACVYRWCMDVEVCVRVYIDDVWMWMYVCVYIDGVWMWMWMYVCVRVYIDDVWMWMYVCRVCI